jgi:hypothetical protein
MAALASSSFVCARLMSIGANSGAPALMASATADLALAIWSLGGGALTQPDQRSVQKTTPQLGCLFRE